MAKPLEFLRTYRLSRVIVAMLLLLAFVSGTSVVVADGEDNSGTECPGDSPEQGSGHASESAFENSEDGRMEAIEGTECN